MNMLKYLLGEIARAIESGDRAAYEHFTERYFAECAELGRIMREVMPGATFH